MMKALVEIVECLDYVPSSSRARTPATPKCHWCSKLATRIIRYIWNGLNKLDIACEECAAICAKGALPAFMQGVQSRKQQAEEIPIVAAPEKPAEAAKEKQLPLPPASIDSLVKKKDGVKATIYSLLTEGATLESARVELHRRHPERETEAMLKSFKKQIWELRHFGFIIEENNGQYKLKGAAV